jgi:hypothetical protein
MRTLLLALASLLLLAGSMLADDFSVSGRVIDSQGYAIPVARQNSKRTLKVCAISRVSPSKIPRWDQSARTDAESAVESQSASHFMTNDPTLVRRGVALWESAEVKPRGRNDGANRPIADEKSPDPWW